MALIGSLSSFVLASGTSSRCSECLKEIPAHSYALVPEVDPIFRTKIGPC